MTLSQKGTKLSQKMKIIQHSMMKISWDKMLTKFIDTKSFLIPVNSYLLFTYMSQEKWLILNNSPPTYCLFILSSFPPSYCYFYCFHYVRAINCPTTKSTTATKHAHKHGIENFNIHCEHQTSISYNYWPLQATKVGINYGSE